MNKKKLTREELRAFLMRIQKEVSTNKKHLEEAEEYVRKYGTLTPEDLMKRFDI